MAIAKKVVSFALHKTNKKPIKNATRKQNLKKMFNKVMNYMKSDTYMFAPLLDPQSSPTTSFGGGVSFEPLKKKEKKLVKDIVEDYLKCDCYMYAPLAIESKVDCAITPIGVNCDQMEPRTEETTVPGGNTLTTSKDNERNDDIYAPARKIGVKRIRVQQETVKHIVHQNFRSSASPGKASSQKEPRKASVK